MVRKKWKGCVGCWQYRMKEKNDPLIQYLEKLNWSNNTDCKGVTSTSLGQLRLKWSVVP